MHLQCFICIIKEHCMTLQDKRKDSEASRHQLSPAIASDDGAAGGENWPAIPSLAGGKDHEIMPSDNESDAERVPEGGVNNQVN